MVNKATIHPPVPMQKALRGKIAYDREKCIGCGICETICPVRVIQLYQPAGEETNNIRMYVVRHAF
ncbi:MAG: 4Fe-4S binding protein [Candidatus Bipolaricaulia bacterium]